MPTEEMHSFVVPAYGHSPHLVECLASLRRQTHRSQIVIATATPFDGLADIARNHDARLSVNSDGGGIGRDWNFALSQASTPWVTLAHQDDIYLPGFTESALAIAARHSDTRLVLTGYGELAGTAERRVTAMLTIKRLLLEFGFLGRDVVSSRGAKLRLLQLGCPIPCPSVTLKLEAPLLRFREDLRVNLDWDAWARLASDDGAFGYDRSVQMLHRIHDRSETSEGIRDGTRVREDLMMFQRFWPAPIAQFLAYVYAYSYEAG